MWDALATGILKFQTQYLRRARASDKPVSRSSNTAMSAMGARVAASAVLGCWPVDTLTLTPVGARSVDTAGNKLSYPVDMCVPRYGEGHSIDSMDMNVRAVPL